MPYAGYSATGGPSLYGYTASDPRTGQVLEQSSSYWGGSGMVPMPLQYGDDSLEMTRSFGLGFARWNGPRTGVGRMWAAHLGARATLAQRGETWQDFQNLRLPPPNIPWVERVAKSLRATTQKFSHGTSNYAVPSVFVPTSTRSMYGWYGS